jgi:hypothetical protein
VHHARVVEVALGDQREAAAAPVAELRDERAELAPERHGRGVDDAVDRIEPQRIDVVLVEPVQRVAAQEAPHLVAAGPVDVDRRAPRGVVAVAHVRREPLEVVALGAEVVVDHVEHDRETPRVAGVDEPSQTVGPAVGRLRRPQVDAVVAPVAGAGELRDGHDLERGDAELDEVVEPRDRRVERALGGEGPDVHLVDHELGDRGRPEPLVGPRERRRIHHGGGAVHAVRLPARRRIGQLVAAVEAVAVPRARRDVRACGEVAARLRLHRQDALVGREQAELDALGTRRPHAEVVRPVVEPRRAKPV